MIIITNLIHIIGLLIKCSLNKRLNILKTLYLILSIFALIQNSFPSILNPIKLFLLLDFSNIHITCLTLDSHLFLLLLGCHL